VVIQDKNQDHKVTFDELLAGLSRLGYTEDHIEILFGNIDTNGNALIECEEWVRYRVSKSKELQQGLGRGRKQRNGNPNALQKEESAGADSNGNSVNHLRHLIISPVHDSEDGKETHWMRSQSGAAEAVDTIVWDECFALLLMADYAQCAQVLRFPLFLLWSCCIARTQIWRPS